VGSIHETGSAPHLWRCKRGRKACSWARFTRQDTFPAAWRQKQAERPARGLDSRDMARNNAHQKAHSWARNNAHQKAHSWARFTRPRGAEQVGCYGLDSRDGTSWSRRIRIEKPVHDLNLRNQGPSDDSSKSPLVGLICKTEYLWRLSSLLSCRKARSWGRLTRRLIDWCHICG
jgi:hypothetical protein